MLPLRTLLLALALIAIFLAQILSVVRREVMTNDEGYHTYAGFRYWQCADFGVNPEHPPLAKLIAALTPGELHAFSASDVSKELWKSDSEWVRDTFFGNYHFGQFTVTNGHLFAPNGVNHVVVYGLFPK